MEAQSPVTGQIVTLRITLVSKNKRDKFQELTTYQGFDDSGRIVDGRFLLDATYQPDSYLSA